MEPTITNAFNSDSTDSRSGKDQDAANHWGVQPGSPRHSRKSLAASLAPMQADLREATFGWSLDLSPMQAIDALHGILAARADQGAALQFLVNLEQPAWRDGEHEMLLSEIAQRLAIPVIQRMSVDQLIMDAIALRQVVSVCQPSRLVVVAVEGLIDERDAQAINKALDGGRSPLLAELRAVLAMEVLGDRSVVLHCRAKETALALVADNFRYYLSALNNRPAAIYEAPESWQIERLLSISGTLTLRPIETQIFSTSIDVGVNTARERFSQPANRSLIYDIPSNSWHDEP